MKIYQVGGAVRDKFLGLPVHDRDWVVVGSTPEAMISQGFKAVGKAFPVFLHPQTHEEYALARKERKVGAGYQGFECYFAPDVTLEEDLSRRDLTINAMALDSDDHLIDPYGGLKDLHAKLLRHVSPAFKEDPLRILRIARFAARFKFFVAPETQRLLTTMVQSHELDYLSAERVWKEWERGFSAQAPARMIQVLQDCGALQAVWPRWAALFQQSGKLGGYTLLDCGQWVQKGLEKIENLNPSSLVLNQNNTGLPERLLLSITLFICGWYALAAAQPSIKTQEIQTLKQEAQQARWPKTLIDLQYHVIQIIDLLEKSDIAFDAAAIVQLFEKLDGIRRPQQSALVIEILKSIILIVPECAAWKSKLEFISVCFQSLKTISPHEWLGKVENSQIPKKLYQARLITIQQLSVKYFN